MWTKRHQAAQAVIITGCVILVLALPALLASPSAPLTPFTSPAMTPSHFNYIPLIVCDDCPTPTARPTLPGPTDTPTARPTP